MTRRGTIRNMSRVHHELAKIRRERAREAATTPTASPSQAVGERASSLGVNLDATNARDAMANLLEAHTDVDACLEQIARTTLGLETLETRRSDGLDFHDLAVWQIKQALQAAYEAGRASAK